MKVRIHDSWKEALHGEFEKTYFKELTDFVRGEYKLGAVYPAPKNIFRALDLCAFNKVKVVILGQDPYHGPGQANGLSFAVPEGTSLPPSLQNIFKEMESDVGARPASGNLEHWAKQGVLLLNATLTVLPGLAGSHQKKGWEKFTDAIIQAISDQKEHVVFILWGRYAQDKGSMIDTRKHLILKSVHPSPLSAHRGFFGSKPFSQTNAFLMRHHHIPIEWVDASAS